MPASVTCPELETIAATLSGLPSVEKAYVTVGLAPVAVAVALKRAVFKALPSTIAVGAVTSPLGLLISAGSVHFSICPSVIQPYILHY